MKVNFKIAPDFQLGHLYEHIFINQFTKRLREADFLAFLDYEIYGETHSNGFIIIYVQAFSENCAEFINDNFDNFSLDFSEEEVAAAAIQIFAEKQMISDGSLRSKPTVSDESVLSATARAGLQAARLYQLLHVDVLVA